MLLDRILFIKNLFVIVQTLIDAVICLIISYYIFLLYIHIYALIVGIGFSSHIQSMFFELIYLIVQCMVSCLRNNLYYILNLHSKALTLFYCIATVYCCSCNVEFYWLHVSHISD